MNKKRRKKNRKKREAIERRWLENEQKIKNDIASVIEEINKHMRPEVTDYRQLSEEENEAVTDLMVNRVEDCNFKGAYDRGFISEEQMNTIDTFIQWFEAIGEDTD